MKIAITGGTGFIGNHIINDLLKSNHELIVTGTNLKKAKNHNWFNKVIFFELDINNLQDESIINEISKCDKLIHLAWAGLPNYKDLIHIEMNLFPQYLFLKKAISKGLKDITITGTCLEYGMKEGCLKNNLITNPENPYALAKDTLRKFLNELQKKEIFNLKWLRLFYMHGNGQSERSIIPQLIAAIDRGDEFFNMSGGEQLRDYLTVEQVSNKIIQYSLKDDSNGIYNICSGKPISIKKLAQNYIKKKNSKIKLNLGYYPYNDYEPMAFWGNNDKKIKGSL